MHPHTGGIHIYRYTDTHISKNKICFKRQKKKKKKKTEEKKKNKNKKKEEKNTKNNKNKRQTSEKTKHLHTVESEGRPLTVFTTTLIFLINISGPLPRLLPKKTYNK